MRQDWKYCQSRCKTSGPDNIIKKFIQLNPNDLDPQIISTCEEIIKDINVQDIEILGEKSTGVLTFYVWVSARQW